MIVLSCVACTESRQYRLMQVAEEKVAEGQYTEAADQLHKAIALRRESHAAVKALFKLGFVQETYLKDYEGALTSYGEFIRLSRDRVSVYEVQKRIANIYFEPHSDPEKAILAYKKLVSYNPESLETDLFQFRIAQSYFRENNFEQARAEFQQLLEHFPKSQYNAQSRFEIGNAYYMEGKYDIAMEALKQVLRNHSQSEWAGEAEFLMAQCLENQDKLQNALQVYESIRGHYSAPQVLKLRIADLKRRIAKGK